MWCFGINLRLHQRQMQLQSVHLSKSKLCYYYISLFKNKIKKTNEVYHTRFVQTGTDICCCWVKKFSVNMHNSFCKQDSLGSFPKSIFTGWFTSLKNENKQEGNQGVFFKKSISYIKAKCFRESFYLFFHSSKKKKMPQKNPSSNPHNVVFTLKAAHMRGNMWSGIFSIFQIRILKTIPRNFGSV